MFSAQTHKSPLDDYWPDDRSGMPRWRRAGRKMGNYSQMYNMKMAIVNHALPEKDFGGFSLAKREFTGAAMQGRVWQLLPLAGKELFLIHTAFFCHECSSMPSTSFSLKPFIAQQAGPFSISGCVCRKAEFLHISYALSGALDDLLLPAPSDRPERRDNLWRESCFEFFFAEQGAAGYWEVNLSPAGHWNIYHFDSYRQGMRREEKVAALPFRCISGTDAFTLEATLDLQGLELADKALRLAVSVVLAGKNGETSYWALAHPGEKPDFHHRAGFLLAL